MKVSINPSPKIVVVFPDGAEYSLSKPTLGEACDMETELLEAKANGGTGGSKVIINQLVKAGLPEKVARDLDADGVEAIMGVLTNVKKK